jgi:RHS repeat-associated protein
VTEDYTFDPQTGLLTNQKATKNGSLFINLSYNYARNNSVGTLNGKTGHLTKITDNLNTQKNREYEFDVLGRLTKAKGGPTGTLWTQTYTYDRWGNRLTVAKTGTAAGGGTMPLDGIPNLAYDNTSNRINTSGYYYDVNGNMIRSLADDGTTWVKYEYDSANRLNIVRKDDAGQTQLERYQYDSTNARVQSHDFALNRYKTYLNAGGTTMAEFTEFTVAVPVWTKSYTYMGGSQLSTITPNGSGGEYTEYNHPDRLGVKTITNGGTSSEQAHLPFGTALNAESTLQTNNKRFTSYDRSSVTKLDYAVNRTYDSKLGRFSQVDPIGISASSLFAPQTLNLYSYCGNDPVNYVDPSGLFFGRFFRWLGRLITRLLGSRVARRIAIKFVVNFALSGGNFGVAIRSIIPDILQQSGLFPDPRSTVPWLPGSRLPISLGTSSLSKYIIYNFLKAAGAKLGSCDHWLLGYYERFKGFFDEVWKKTQNTKSEKVPDGLEAGGIIYLSASQVSTRGAEEVGWDIYDGPTDKDGNGMGDVFDKWAFEKKRELGLREGGWVWLVVHTHPANGAGPSGPGDYDKAIYSPEATVTATDIVVYKGYYRHGSRQATGQVICSIKR